MLSEIEAQQLVLKTLPGVTIKASIPYHDIFIVRVEFPSPSEKDFDPFFSVDPVTEEVRDFSVLTDGDVNEINQLFIDKYGS